MSDKTDKLVAMIGRLQMAMLDAGLSPAKGIIVDQGTGMSIRAMTFSNGYDINPKMLVEDGYCGHVCGVPFFTEKLKGPDDPRDRLPPYYNSQGN
jgi:hypothetical protein